MSYLEAAFGGFAPHLDEDAAVKFILNVILMDNRLAELAELFIDGNALGAIEGEPSWTLERRDNADEEKPAYNEWPKGARFRAYVDPQGYELAHPEFFIDRSGFVGYLLRVLATYEASNPSPVHLASIQKLRATLPGAAVIHCV
ncbi:MAG: hypothetical protein ACOVO0_13950 [Burkholderiaceae bacterium]